MPNEIQKFMDSNLNSIPFKNCNGDEILLASKKVEQRQILDRKRGNTNFFKKILIVWDSKFRRKKFDPWSLKQTQ